MHDFSRPLAEAVKKARCKMKLTQEQVGELADTNARTISAIEAYNCIIKVIVINPDTNLAIYSFIEKPPSVTHLLVQ